MKHYILKDRKIEEVDFMTWARWLEGNPDRKIAYTDFTGEKQKWRVSTVFLGIDHSFGGEVPLLFETMVFDSGTELDGEPIRWATIEEAEIGHKETVKAVKTLTTK